MPLTSDTNFDGKSGAGMVVVDEGEATEEYAYASGKSGGALTTPVANRGLEGSSAAGHSSGATVKGVITALMWNDLIDSVINVLDQTTGAIKTSLGLTTPQITTSINDTNGNEIIKTPATGSAVNEITVTNAATGNAPQVSATGDDTNIDLDLAGKGTGSITMSMRHQANGTNSTETGVSVQTGWNFINGDGASTRLNETITLPTTFPNEILAVNISLIGNKAGSDPTAITEFTSTTDDGVKARVFAPTTSNFVAEFESDAVLASGTRYGYSWIAYGR